MSTSAPVSLSLDELENTFGVFFVGYAAAMIAYGFTFFQTYVYYSRYPTDHWAIKTMVAVICALDTAISALISHTLYYYFVLLFPYAIGLEHATITFCIQILLSIVVVFIVQMYYVARLTMSCQDYVLPSIIALASTASFGLGITMSINMFNNTALKTLAEPRVKAIVSAAQGLSFLSALLTLGALCYHLHSTRNACTKSSQCWFDKLATYVLARGIAVTIVQFGCFTTFVTMPSKIIWIPFQLLATKLFVNSLLTMLTLRGVYHGRGLYEEDAIPKSPSAPYASWALNNGKMRFKVLDTNPTTHVNSSQTTRGDVEQVTLGDDSTVNSRD